MIAYVYVLALIFVTITNGQVTSWTGGGGSSNNTFSNPLNWSNGAPTTTSIVYVNDTTCTGCTIIVDQDVSVAELHMGAGAANGPYIEIVGVTLTVTNVFSLGSPSANAYYYTYVDIQGGGTFELGDGCDGTIYYTYYPIRSTIQDEENWFVNSGTVTVLGNGGVTAGSYGTMNIGWGSSYPLWIKNWGSWVVSTGAVELQFYYNAGFDIYGGSFTGGWITTTGTSTPTIVWYGTNVVLQEGAGGDPTAGTAAVTFDGAVYFYSTTTQDFTDYDTPNSLTFNTTGVSVTNSLFRATRIDFLYSGILRDCNLTSYTLINSSSTVDGTGVHASFEGNNIMSDSGVAAIDITDFVVQVESDATVTMNDLFALIGTVTLVNNGTWVFDSGSNLYFDVSAYWVNLGLMDVINHSNDYIGGTYFPGRTTVTAAGTFVNMGTIQFTNAGGLDFYYSTGTFLQCKHGIMKWGYAVGNTPGYVTLPSISSFDGFIGFYFEDKTSIPSNGATLFTFVKETSGDLPYGSFISLLDTVTNGPPGVLDSNRLVCWEKTGTVYVYDQIEESGKCPDGKYQILPTPPVTEGDSCDGLPDAIKNLADEAWCPAGANCGLDTGAPAGEPNPNGAHSLAVHLAFLLSLICLLLKF